MPDKAITDFSAAANLNRADLMELVQNVATTPSDSKMSLGVLEDFLDLSPKTKSVVLFDNFRRDDTSLGVISPSTCRTIDGVLTGGDVHQWSAWGGTTGNNQFRIQNQRLKFALASPQAANYVTTKLATKPSYVSVVLNWAAGSLAPDAGSGSIEQFFLLLTPASGSLVQSWHISVNRYYFSIGLYDSTGGTGSILVPFPGAVNTNQKWFDHNIPINCPLRVEISLNGNALTVSAGGKTATARDSRFATWGGPWLVLEDYVGGDWANKRDVLEILSVTAGAVHQTDIAQMDAGDIVSGVIAVDRLGAGAGGGGGAGTNVLMDDGNWTPLPAPLEPDFATHTEVSDGDAATLVSANEAADTKIADATPGILSDADTAAAARDTTLQNTLDALKSNKSITVNAQTGTTYAFVLSDADKLVTFTNAAAITVTLPENAAIAFPVGTRIYAFQGGDGAVTFAPAGGVTVVSREDSLALLAKGSWAILTKTATNIWTLSGDLAGMPSGAGGFTPDRIIYLDAAGDDITSFTTWQAAEDAAAALTPTPDASNPACIVVGVGTAAQFGDLTLTAARNAFVFLAGQGDKASVLGTIYTDGFACIVRGHGVKITAIVGDNSTVAQAIGSVECEGLTVGNVTTSGTVEGTAGGAGADGASSGTTGDPPTAGDSGANGGAGAVGQNAGAQTFLNCKLVGSSYTASGSNGGAGGNGGNGQPGGDATGTDQDGGAGGAGGDAGDGGSGGHAGIITFKNCTFDTVPSISYGPGAGGAGAAGGSGAGGGAETGTGSPGATGATGNNSASGNTGGEGDAIKDGCTPADRLESLDITDGFTLKLGHAGKLLRVTNSGGGTVTIPQHGAVPFPNGTQITIKQVGASVVDVNPDSGVTLNSPNGDRALVGEHSMAVLVKVSTVEWDMTGDLTT